MTINNINAVMEDLLRETVDDIGSRMLLDMHDSAHGFANTVMDAVNGGVCDWIASKSLDDECAVPVFLATVGIIGIDLIQTFIINLHMKGWLKHTMAVEEKIECQGHCPVCGSENCITSVEACLAHRDGPVSCECEDCESTWVCK